MALYRVAQVHERIGRVDVAMAVYDEACRLPSTVYNSQPRGRATTRKNSLDASVKSSVRP